MNDTFYNSAERFVRWLESRVTRDARGDDVATLETKPADTFWLGRLANVSSAAEQAQEERILRLDPCAIGITFQPASSAPWSFTAYVSLRIWYPEKSGSKRIWRKSDPIQATIPMPLASAPAEPKDFGGDKLRDALNAAGFTGHSAKLSVENTPGADGNTLTVTLVNDSPEDNRTDTNFYEVLLRLEVGEVRSFILDSLADSFRYSREVKAYGVNCGVTWYAGQLSTEDTVSTDKNRPIYWDSSAGAQPVLDFSELAQNPKASLGPFLECMERWYTTHWSDQELAKRAEREQWSPEMRSYAESEASNAFAELDACKHGYALLDDEKVQRAFKLMNEAFVISGGEKYTSWRPFQIGFLLAALPGVVSHDISDRRTVSTLWFATGGGKTETYLGIVVFSALYDRILGKRDGITAWSRFPLRMLSLQQTQRFADAIAAAELIRRRASIDGAPISLGYFVGSNGTPNRIRFDPKPNEVNAADPDMPGRYRVLLYCPFCRSEDISMAFDEATWTLQHRCRNEQCPWPDEGLPFYVADEEVFRFLPSVVVGTLDKAASVGIQAAMRGFYAAPLGRCSGPSHGFTYAPRSSTSPSGCLVPDCKHPATALGQAETLFAPRIRVQDELHLLADSLGAIDSHYETLLDHLTEKSGAAVPKIIASSATLAGFSNQVRALYCRPGSVFPMPGPRDGFSFWSQTSPALMRRFIALAPRGHTQEYANDCVARSLQSAVRDFATSPDTISQEIGIDAAHAPALISYYGTNVIYGSRLRDVEGAARSLEAHPPADPTNVATLTSATALQDVLDILKRMKAPEDAFNDRLHVVCCSSMMSHGVDVDRFNTMTMIGMPLSTAEFIQTSARIGRQMPGLVFVLHRMAVERDAKIYRLFDIFVRHGDRLIEPVAITRYSRRVLSRTAPGMFMADIYGLWEPQWMASGNKALTTARELRALARSVDDFCETERDSLADALHLDGQTPPPFYRELHDYMDRVATKMGDVASNARFSSEIAQAPQRVLISLRDVEERIPIREASE